MDTNNNSQEIDILKFFRAIGQFFSNIINAVKSLIVSIFYFSIDFLLYVKKHAIFFGIGIILGLLYAFVTDRDFKPVYFADVKLKTNFGSTAFFENKINLFNNLIQEKKYNELAKELNITDEEAENIINFETSYNVSNVLLFKEFKDYLSVMDTATYKFIEYNDYKKDVKSNPELYPYRNLRVYANNNFIFSKLNKSLLHLFDNDKILQKRKGEMTALYNTTKNEYIKSLEELDTLRKVLNKVYLESSKQSKATSGTNVILSSGGVYGIESPVNIYYNRLISLKELNKVVHKIKDKGNIIELLNSFPVSGEKVSVLKYNPFVKYPALGFILVLFILLLFDFNKFLIKYQEKKAKNDN